MTPSSVIPPLRAAETASKRRVSLIEKFHLDSRFISGIASITVLYTLAKVSTQLTQVLAGRVVGPVEFGKANVALSLSSYLQIPMLLGFPVALSKFLPTMASPDERDSLISSMLTSVLCWTVLCLTPAVLFHNFFSAILKVDASLYFYSLMHAAATAAFLMTGSPLLGLGRFGRRGFAEILYGLSSPVFLGCCLPVFGANHYSNILISLILALGLGTVYNSILLRPHLRPKAFPGLSDLKPIFRYSLFASFNLLATVSILGGPRLILSRYFSNYEVGVFSAYFSSTAQISCALVYMLGSALVPLTANAARQQDVWKLLSRYCLPALLASWLSFAILGAGALLCFGRHYPFNKAWILLFSAAAALILLHGVLCSIFAARDFSGLVISVGGNLATGISNLILGWLFIPAYGTEGAAVSLLLAHMIGLGFYFLSAIQSSNNFLESSTAYADLLEALKMRRPKEPADLSA